MPFTCPWCEQTSQHPDDEHDGYCGSCHAWTECRPDRPCDLHNTHCEPPSELCCGRCSEGRHPDHPAGVACVLDLHTPAAPDPSSPVPEALLDHPFDPIPFRLDSDPNDVTWTDWCAWTPGRWPTPEEGVCGQPASRHRPPDRPPSSS